MCCNWVPTLTGGKTVAIDATCPCPLCPTHVHAGTADSARSVTREAEIAKASKHRADCERLGYKYTTAAMTSFGGWGDDFLRTFVRPHYRAMRAHEKAAGGTGWETVAAQHRFFERASIVMARANAAMVAVAKAGPQRVASAGRGEAD